jgi:hypothetical protein
MRLPEIFGKLLYMICTYNWELMKSMGSHDSLSLSFIMKMVVWRFVSNSHKVMTFTHCCVTSKVLLWQVEVYVAASDSAVHTRIRGFCVSCYECNISSFESVGKVLILLGINSLPSLRNDLHKCKGCTAIPHQICCAHLSCLDIYLYSDFWSECCFCLQESQANCLDPWCYSMMMYLLLQLLHKVAKIYQARAEADVTAMVGHMSWHSKADRMRFILYSPNDHQAFLQEYMPFKDILCWA